MMFSIYKNGSHTYEVRKQRLRRVDGYCIARTKPKKCGGEYLYILTKRGFYDSPEEAQDALDRLADERDWQWCGEVKEVKGNV